MPLLGNTLKCTALLFLWGFLLAACRTDKTGIDINQYILDTDAAYRSSVRFIADSLFRLHRGKEDSLYAGLGKDEIFKERNNTRYLDIKYLERKLNNRNYSLFDSLYARLAGDSLGILPELQIEWKLLFAVRIGIKGQFENSDRLFKAITGEGERIFLPQYDLMLRIREKHAEMWRYDANNPGKAMAILQVLDTILAGRPGFTGFHRNQLYTLATTHRVLGKFDDALAHALILREKLNGEPVIDSNYLISVSKVLANIYTDMDDPNEANRYFEEHIRYNLSKNRLKAHDLINFAIQLSRNYQFEKADTFLDRALPMVQTPEDSFYYQRTMAFHMMHQQRQEEARPYLAWVRTYCSNRYDYQLCPSSTYWLGEYYDLTGKPDSAIPLYREAVSHVCGKPFERIQPADLVNKKDVELYYSMLAMTHVYLNILLNNRKIWC